MLNEASKSSAMYVENMHYVLSSNTVMFSLTEMLMLTWKHVVKETLRIMIKYKTIKFIITCDDGWTEKNF